MAWKRLCFHNACWHLTKRLELVGSYAKKLPAIAYLWSEAVSGQRFWLDNCAAQNKNWGLFLFLMILINTDFIHAKEIMFKFFESGHTFMAADNFHAEMRQNPPITYPVF